MLLALQAFLDTDVDPNSPGTMRTSDDYIDSNVRLALSAAGMVRKHASLLLYQLPPTGASHTVY